MKDFDQEGFLLNCWEKQQIADSPPGCGSISSLPCLQISQCTLQHFTRQFELLLPALATNSTWSARSASSEVYVSCRPKTRDPNPWSHSGTDGSLQMNSNSQNTHVLQTHGFFNFIRVLNSCSPYIPKHGASIRNG
jgi:hypothetical protein